MDQEEQLSSMHTAQHENDDNVVVVDDHNNKEYKDDEDKISLHAWSILSKTPSSQSSQTFNHYQFQQPQSYLNLHPTKWNHHPTLKLYPLNPFILINYESKFHHYPHILLYITYTFYNNFPRLCCCCSCSRC